MRSFTDETSGLETIIASVECRRCAYRNMMPRSVNFVMGDCCLHCGGPFEITNLTGVVIPADEEVV